MSRYRIVNQVPIYPSARVKQLEGIFDVPPSERSIQEWDVNLPIDGDGETDWQIGLIVGASGSGKSTVARQAFGNAIVHGYEWPQDRAVVDGFASGLSIKDITQALSSVGFSSPPSWLRPFFALSNGEQFRASLARSIVDPAPMVVVDEFTSVVDRQVARIGSAAVSKAIRRIPNKKFVAVTCHFDVEEWLDPDWVLEMPEAKFRRRSLQGRPKIKMEIRKGSAQDWPRFRKHHYLNHSLNPSAQVYLAFVEIDGVFRECALTSYISAVGMKGWRREHRTVVLPDFQGISVGNNLVETVAEQLWIRQKIRFRSTTASPAFIAYRYSKKDRWVLVNQGMANYEKPETVKARGMHDLKKAKDRVTTSWVYIPKDLRK